MCQSAIVRRSRIDVESAVRLTISNSPSIDDCGPITGLLTLPGSASATVASFSDTICRSRYMSVPQSNSTHTTEKPLVDEDLTLLTSGAPFMAVSMGKVTSCSTSSAAIPLASVMTTTVGALRSGKTSTSVRLTVYMPATVMSTAATATSRRLSRENRMILSSMSVGDD